MFAANKTHYPEAAGRRFQDTTVDGIKIVQPTEFYHTLYAWTSALVALKYHKTSIYCRVQIRQYCSCAGTVVLYLCTRSWLMFNNIDQYPKSLERISPNPVKPTIRYQSTSFFFRCQAPVIKLISQWKPALKRSLCNFYPVKTHNPRIKII